MGSNMGPSGSELGTTGATGGPGRPAGNLDEDGVGYVNKAAMLEDEAAAGGVCFLDLQGKDGIEDEYSPDPTAGADPHSPGREARFPLGGGPPSPGASPVDPPDYEIPVCPPEYTRHPSYMEIGDVS